MPSASPQNIAIWKRRFRRKYASDVAGLKALADQLAAEAAETVSLTNFNEDGQSGGGVVTGNKMEMMEAAELVIAELDEAAANLANRDIRVIYPVISGIPH